ncbi:putative NADH-flavin reductase [Bradyrhizobium sp. F1.13.1]
MKIAVAGASGRAGSEITKELSRRGHAVTAIARNPEKIAALPNVTPTKGDVLDQSGLAKLWAGHDVAVSSVHFLASDALKLIGAAKDSKVGRYLVVGRCRQPGGRSGRQTGDNSRLSGSVQG